jgi:hypothetical protein
MQHVLRELPSSPVSTTCCTALLEAHRKILFVIPFVCLFPPLCQLAQNSLKLRKAEEKKRRHYGRIFVRRLLLAEEAAVCYLVNMHHLNSQLQFFTKNSRKCIGI